MNSHLKVLKSAHEEYVKVKEYATGDEEEMDLIVVGFNTFLKEVEKLRTGF